MIKRSTNYRNHVVSGLSVLLLAVMSTGCLEQAEPAPDVEDPQNEELGERSNPGLGTGRATWTVRAGRNKLVITTSVNDGDAAEPDLTGTPPPFSALPLSVTNADGETLRITKEIVDGRTQRVYRGSYDISLDSDASAAECTYCYCGFDGLGPCSAILASMDCSSTKTGCSNWACAPSGGGGGVTTTAVDFTFSQPPAQ